ALIARPSRLPNSSASYLLLPASRPTLRPILRRSHRHCRYRIRHFHRLRYPYQAMSCHLRRFSCRRPRLGPVRPRFDLSPRLLSTDHLRPSTTVLTVVPSTRMTRMTMRTRKTMKTMRCRPHAAVLHQPTCFWQIRGHMLSLALTLTLYIYNKETVLER